MSGKLHFLMFFSSLILCSLGIHKLVIILYLQCGFNALSFRFVDAVDWSLLQVLFINIH